MTGIYIIENIANGKKYIGSAKDIYQRWVRHKNKLRRGTHENQLLQHAYNKYTESCFRYSVLLYCDIQTLLFYEQRALDSFKSYVRKYGYNICRTAGNTLGRKHTDLSKKKMSEYRKGRKFSEQHKENLSRALKGKQTWLIGVKHSDLTRKKMSIAQSGERHSGCKLSENQVIEIHRMRPNHTLRELALMYHVSMGCINGIVNGYTWKHLNQK